MKHFSSLLAVIVCVLHSASAQIPDKWESRGIGGGGAMFAPSINPANDNEFYAGCDMSELFHSTDFGKSYSVGHFKQVNGGHNSTVRFTSTPGLLYTISYKLNGNIDQIVPVKSTDNGITWSNLPGNPDPTEETFTINADYANPQRVILSYYGEIHFSQNGGMTFTRIHSAKDNGTGVIVGGVFFDGNMIYIGTNDGLLVSKDGGQTFAIDGITGLGANEAIWSFAAAKQNGTTRLFCLTGSTNDMYVGKPGSEYEGFVRGVYSLDYPSAVWTKKMSGITLGTDHVMFVGMAENDISTCYLAGSRNYEPHIMKTSNAGTTWVSMFNTANNENITTGWSGNGGDRAWTYGECAFGFAVAPNNSQKLLFGDFGFIHTSTDGGNTWNQRYVDSSTQNPAGSKTPTGKSYKSIGLENTTCWQVTWQDATTMFACFSDIKGVRSTDGGASWSFNYSGHGANSMYRITAATNGTLYAATSNVHDMYQSTRLADAQLNAPDSYGKVIYSTDKGASWKDIHNFGHPVFWVALDPKNENICYASVIHSTEGGIYHTKNLQNGAAATWSKLPAPPRTEGHPASIVVLNDGRVVCTFSGRRAPAFTASSGCFVYTPGTNSWADVSDKGMKYWTKDIVIDPNDPTQNTWLVSVFSGWGVSAAVEVGGLYRTRDAGKSWTRIWQSDRVTSCTFNPAKPSELYVTTEVEGLWHTENITSAAPTFTLVNSYPFRQPERVFFNPFNPGELWVTSFGHGMRVGSSSTSDKFPAPVLRLPSNKSNDAAVKGRLEWQHVENADVYYAALSSSPDFTNSFLSDNRSFTTSIEYSLSPKTTYYWKVKANKLLSKDGQWSEVWSFTTGEATPLMPDTAVLLTPKNASVDQATSIVCTWKSSLNAEKYRLQLSKNELFTDIVHDSSGVSQFHEITGLAHSTTYYWRVQASNSALTAPWSETWHFTTKASVGVELPNETTSLSMKVTPNPLQARGHIRVSTAIDRRITLRLLDILGRETQLVFDGNVATGEHDIHMQALPTSGVYRLLLTDGIQSIIEPLVIVQ